MSELKRFFSKVKITSSCWLWTASKLKNGYGQFRGDKRMYLSHRLSYELIKGKIPDNLCLDHLCRNRLCCNPNHLEVVTLGENIRRGESGLYEKLRTYCPYGHKYAGKNLFISKNNKRACKECHRINSNKYYHKNKHKKL